MTLDFHEHGRPIVDASACTGCGKCVEICPDAVFSINSGKAAAGKGKFIGCIACGHCVAVCPSEAIEVEGRGMMVGDRIDLPGADDRATAEQLDALLLARRSVRLYKEREIPKEIIDRILSAISTAPMGVPPSNVGVMVFHGREKVRRFAADACEAFKRLLKKLNPLMMTFMRLTAKKADYKAMRDFIVPLLKFLVEMHGKEIDSFIYDAPAVLLFHFGPTDDSADAHIAATYAMLAAESLGLGTCLIGSTAALNHDKLWRQKYGIPPEHKISLAITLGYPAVEFHSAIRRRLASVAFVQ
jgi:nitroreductase/NAD-dependent dihydropyrimidine dehydrogenase PreA subunit